MKNNIKKLHNFIREKIPVNSTNNKLVVLSITIMILSMILGSIYSNSVNLNIIKRLDVLFLSDFDNRNTQNMFYTFISSFSSNFLFWIAMLFSSTSFLGPIFVPLLLIFRGAGLGLMGGYLYLIYSFKGIAFYILVLLPGIFISSACFVIMFVNSERFAIKVAKVFLPNTTPKILWKDMLIYIKKSGFILCVLAISSLLDMIFMKLFSGLFIF